MQLRPGEVIVELYFLDSIDLHSIAWELWEILFPGFSFLIICTNDLKIDVSNQMARRKLHVGTNALFWFLIPFFLQEDFSSLTLD